jgi:hypothetical protein
MGAEGESHTGGKKTQIWPGYGVNRILFVPLGSRPGIYALRFRSPRTLSRY